MGTKSTIAYNDEIKKFTVKEFKDIEPKFLKIISIYKEIKDESEIIRKLREQVSNLTVENLNLREELKSSQLPLLNG